MEIKRDFNNKIADSFKDKYVRTYARDNLEIKRALSYKENRPSWYITRKLVNVEIKRLKALPMIPVVWEGL